MQKRTIIILCSLLVVATLVWVIFSKKKTVNIEIQNVTNSSQDSENNDQETFISNQETVNSEQETIINEQESEISEQKMLINNQEVSNNNQETQQTGKTKQNTENKPQTKNETKSSDSKIIDRFISWGFEKATSRKIDTIIVHSSYDALGDDPYDTNGLIAEYKQYGVAAHYLIARGGEIYHLVEDKNIAYHAGESKVPDGRTGVNVFSIGIEMMNTEDGKFTNKQYSALNSLLSILKKQYSIKYILGHSDIAPSRKTDPWNIEWNKVQK